MSFDSFSLCLILSSYLARISFLFRLIPPTDDSTDQLRHLIKKCNYFLGNQQRQFSSHLKTLQSGYPGFDWFLSSIFLIMGGKVDATWEFLSCFSTLLASGYMWIARFHASVSPVFILYCFLLCPTDKLLLCICQ